MQISTEHAWKMENDIKLLYLIFDIKKLLQCICKQTYIWNNKWIQGRKVHWWGIIQFHHDESAEYPKQTYCISPQCCAISSWSADTRHKASYSIHSTAQPLQRIWIWFWIRGYRTTACSLIVNNEMTKPTIFRYKHSLAQVVIITEREWFSCV